MGQHTDSTGLLDLLPDAHALLALDGEILWAGDRFAALVSSSANELRGRPVQELFGAVLPLVDSDFAVSHAVGGALLETLGRRIDGRLVGRPEEAVVVVSTRQVIVPVVTSALRPRPMTTQGARRGRVLVIDDEPTIGKVLERILAEYTVVIVGDAREALTRLANETFDVIVCDLMLPRMSGMEFFQQFQKTRPDLAPRVVFLTGGAFTPGARQFLTSIPNRHLRKPFEASAVRRLVSDVLEDTSSSQAARDTQR